MRFFCIFKEHSLGPIRFHQHIYETDDPKMIQYLLDNPYNGVEFAPETEEGAIPKLLGSDFLKYRASDLPKSFHEIRRNKDRQVASQKATPTAIPPVLEQEENPEQKFQRIQEEAKARVQAPESDHMLLYALNGKPFKTKKTAEEHMIRKMRKDTDNAFEVIEDPFSNSGWVVKRTKKV